MLALPVLIFAGLAVACTGDDPGLATSEAATATATPAPTAAATPEVAVETSISTEYYEVLGNSTQEILSYIKDKGPLDGDGSRASGLTRAEWSLEWSRASTTRTCAVRTMTISMTLVMILPQLDLDALPENLRDNWIEYANNIAVHEQRHVDIYLEGAETLKQRMEEVPSQADCVALEDRVTTIWEDQRTTTNEAQNQFHGTEQARIEAKRGPLRDQIDLNNGRLASLLVQIDQLDATIADLDEQLDSIAPQVESLSEAIEAIEDEYDGTSLPPDVQEQYQSLRSQYIALLPAYNSLVAQYNDAVGRRNALAREHSQLTDETNALIETFNWLN